MAINKDKVVAAAQRFIQKGQLDKAIQEYLRIVEETPSDVRTWLKIGDLHAKRGSRPEATQTYVKVAEFYSAQGFYLKAVAVYKQVLKLDPSLYDVNLKLAELYQQLGLLSDALGQYEVVAAHLMRLGRNRDALSALRRMVDLDPENVASRIKLAEGFSKEGMVDDAAEEFARACTSLKEQGRREDFVKVAERLLYHRPNDISTARDLAGIYLQQNDTKRALAKLHLCVKADPRDVPTLELLAQAFSRLGQSAKTVSVLREVARIHSDQGRAAERMEVLTRIQEMDPSDTEVRRVLGPDGTPEGSGRETPAPAVVGSVRGSSPPGPGPAAKPVAAARPQVQSDGAQADILQRALVAATGRSSSPGTEEAGRVARRSDPPRRRSEPPREKGGEVELRRILSETEVFLKYGLRAKAIEHLRRIFEIDAANVEAHERLRDLYLQAGQREEAVTELLALARIMTPGRKDRAVAYAEEALRLDPNSREAREIAGSQRPSAHSDPFVDAAIDGSAFEEPSTYVDSDNEFVPAPDFEDDFGDEATGEEVVVDLTSDSDVPPPPTERPSRPPDDTEGLPAVLAAGVVDVSPPPDNVIPFPGARSREVALPEGLRPATEVIGAGGAGGTDVEDSLEECDFFMAQGLHEEARMLLNDLLSAHPGHRVLLDKLAELDELTGAAAPDDADPDDADEPFTVTDHLVQAMGGEEVPEGADFVNVDAVFEQFKRGIEQQVSADDWATHLDLGIAYKEMGLLDDAIQEFQVAMRNPEKECQCHTLVGLCHMEKGAYGDAVGAFKRGLYVEGKSPLEELALYYELGNAYEHMRDGKSALDYFQKVADRDLGFRDVGERIRALAGAPTSDTSDEVDRAFDDLVDTTRKPG